MIVLGSLSAMGVMVATQQYFFLQGQKELMLIRREQDESFLIVMKSVGGEANPEMDKELALQKEIIEGSDSNIVAMNSELEIRAIGEGIIGCVVFVLSVWALYLNDRKQT
jgi:hypothetical protein